MERLLYIGICRGTWGHVTPSMVNPKPLNPMQRKMEIEMESGMKRQGSGRLWAWIGIFYRDSVGM